VTRPGIEPGDRLSVKTKRCAEFHVFSPVLPQVGWHQVGTFRVRSVRPDSLGTGSSCQPGANQISARNRPRGGLGTSGTTANVPTAHFKTAPPSRLKDLRRDNLVGDHHLGQPEAGWATDSLTVMRRREVLWACWPFCNVRRPVSDVGAAARLRAIHVHSSGQIWAERGPKGIELTCVGRWEP
jgi:hypothetical protein